jgi:hypothetical protein
MRCQAKLGLSIGGDEPTWEGEVEVEFEYTPGSPGTGPSYACGGTPPDPAELEVVRIVKIDGRKPELYAVPKETLDTLIDHIECDDRLMEELFKAGAVDYVEGLAAAQEARYREREED